LVGLGRAVAGRSVDVVDLEVPPDVAAGRTELLTAGGFGLATAVFALVVTPGARLD
jgi:hypothetical protein